MADRDRIPEGDKVKVKVTPHEGTGELPSIDDIRQEMGPAGWSDDPGKGRAIMLEDGREVLNPQAMAPPIGYEPVPTLMELMDRMVRKHLVGLRGDDVLDETAEESMDFDIDDEDRDPLSVYEIIDMQEEYPALRTEPKASPVSELPPEGATPDQAAEPPKV